MASFYTPLVSRHENRFLLNMASRRAVVRFFSLPLDCGMQVKISWKYCYDNTHIHPDWKEIQGSEALASVSSDGSLEFSLMFGPPSPSDVTEKEKPVNQCTIVLTRPGEGATHRATDIVSEKAPVLPTLMYTLRAVDGDEILSFGEVALNGFWGDTIFNEAIDVFNRFGGVDMPFLDKHAVVRMLRARWDLLFGHLRKGEHLREKGEHGCKDDGETLVPVGGLSIELIERIMTVGCGPCDSVHQEIPRRAFCGASPTVGTSIWRVFQNIAELVGRSQFIRQLFNFGQLHVLSATEMMEIHTDKLAELGEPFVYFFRVPRSIVHEAALVIELFEVEYVDNSTNLKAVRPTPYITASQLEQAKGNPFIAFANLESVHSEKLKALRPRGLLQPPNIQIKSRVDSDYQSRAFTIESNVKLIPGSDGRWWSRAH